MLPSAWIQGAWRALSAANDIPQVSQEGSDPGGIRSRSAQGVPKAGAERSCGSRTKTKFKEFLAWSSVNEGLLPFLRPGGHFVQYIAATTTITVTVTINGTVTVARAVPSQLVELPGYNSYLVVLLRGNIVSRTYGRHKNLHTYLFFY